MGTLFKPSTNRDLKIVRGKTKDETFVAYKEDLRARGLPQKLKQSDGVQGGLRGPTLKKEVKTPGSGGLEETPQDMKIKIKYKTFPEEPTRAA